MIDWQKINTVLLDMDGTLLDLNFDNHFWHEFVPERYAQQHHISLTKARQHLLPLFKTMEGKLEWYCLDYWSQTLQLDIAGLKAEIAELIAVLPHVMEFLEIVRTPQRRLILVTNAHPGSLNLKMEKTCLQPFFDAIISSHSLGYAKEQAPFWPLLQTHYPFSNESTLLIDDSLKVLQAARDYGIAHLVAVTKPDSKKAVNATTDFLAIEDFRELTMGIG